MSYPHHGAAGSGAPSQGIHCGVGFVVQAEVVLVGLVTLTGLEVIGVEVVIGMLEVPFPNPSEAVKDGLNVGEVTTETPAPVLVETIPMLEKLKELEPVPGRPVVIGNPLEKPLGYPGGLPG